MEESGISQANDVSQGNGANQANDKSPATQEDKTRSKFGTRYLTDKESVFQHNAWDNAVWDEEQEMAAHRITMNHIKNMAPTDKKEEYERDAAKYWDKFYNIHSNHFFKDRHWLFTEFPELYGVGDHRASSSSSGLQGVEEHHTSSSSGLQGEEEHHTLSSSVLRGKEVQSDCVDHEKHTGQSSWQIENDGHFNLESLKQEVVTSNSVSTSSFRLLEVGCGVGNTVFPILQTNKNPDLLLYCCDFSPSAIDIVKAHPDYEEKRCHAFVLDITASDNQVPFPAQSLDIIIMIFVLSAVSPDKMADVVRRLASFLKPGGMILFRDYGRYDMAQLRFKESRCLSESCYVRGDGTMVYFFTQDELKEMFGQAGLIEKENTVDRRLQVNRCRQLKMYRVWIQCKYIKPQ